MIYYLLTKSNQRLPHPMPHKMKLPMMVGALTKGSRQVMLLPYYLSGLVCCNVYLSASCVLFYPILVTELHWLELSCHALSMYSYMLCQVWLPACMLGPNGVVNYNNNTLNCLIASMFRSLQFMCTMSGCCHFNLMERTSHQLVLFLGAFILLLCVAALPSHPFIPSTLPVFES